MARLKSCKYCGRIHDTQHICQQKQVSLDAQQKKFKATSKDRFRWTKAWQDKRERIKERDHFLCQLCIRNIQGTSHQYNHEGLSVHHIVSLEEDFGKRLDSDNLITSCDIHHELMEGGEIPRGIVMGIVEEQEELHNR